MMKRIVIVEDEKNAQEALSKMIKLILPSAEIVACFKSVQEAVAYLQSHEIDVLLLDIELEDGTGFELLERLEEHRFALIFTTAFNEFAIKAFKFSAIDYLLKPIDPMELKDALQRAHKLSSRIPLVKPNPEKQKIVLHTQENSHVIPVKSIIRLEADGSYTTFITEEEKVMVSKNLKHYEELLADHDFIRCHQSHLIAKNHIKSFTNLSLTMVNGDLVPVSHRRKHLLKQLN